MTHQSISDRLIAHLAEEGAARDGVGAKSVRASASGACPRQRAYLAFRPDLAAPVEPKAMARFRLGDVGHDSLRRLLGAAKVDFSHEEAEVRTPVSVVGIDVHPLFRPLLDEVGEVAWIPGHIDGLLHEHVAADGWTGDAVLEIKTVGAWPWKIAADMRPPGNGEGRVSQPYVDQNLTYQRALEAQRGVLLYWCVERDKEAEEHPTFPFIEIEVPWDPVRWAAIEASWRTVLASGPDRLPERPFAPVPETHKFKPTGRQVLPWQCGYCAFVGTCWPQAKLDPDAPKAKTYVVPA